MTPAGGNWKEMVHAAEKGDLELVRYHVMNGVDVNYQHPEFMTTPLIISIENQQYAIAKFFLENGADPTTKEIFGHHTPLTAAQLTKNNRLVALVKSFLAA
ncbi:MAG: ankyrin repeat domain-containing protein [Bacteroidota bacterium]